jgi:hypothetical protein
LGRFSTGYNVNKAEVLCDRDRAMLTAFSERALARITGRSLNALLLPLVTEYMNANVMKEVEKDRIIIEQAVSAFKAGTSVENLAVDDIFEMTKGVDKNFVKGLLIPSLAIKVKYEDIADIRKKRITCLSRAVFTLVENWADSLPFETRIRQSYSEQEFKTTMAEILHLYNQETRALSSSIHFLNPFNPAIQFIAGTLFDAMEAAARDLTADCATKIFGEKSNV